MHRAKARFSLTAAVLSAVGLAVTQGGAAITASAAPTQTSVVTDVASTQTPRVPGGQCYAGVLNPQACREVLKMIKVGGWIYAGGIVSQVANPITNTVASGFSNLFRFNAVTHQLDTSFKPQFFRTRGRVDDARVTGLAASADGSSLYVAGRFTNVASAPGGAANPRRSLAKINASTGAVDTAFNARLCASGGGCMASDVQLVADQSVWVAGNFTTVNTTSRTALASLDPATGALTNNVQLAIAGAPVITAGTKVTKISVNPASTRAVILGNFGSVAGQSRQEVALLDVNPATGSAPSVNAWNAPTHLVGSVSRCAKNDIWPRDADWDPTGSFFDIAASGGGGLNPWPALCDTYSRWQDNGNANSVPVIYNNSQFDSFFSVCDVGGWAYVGGHFKSLNRNVRINGSLISVPRAQVNEIHYGLGVINTTNALAVTPWNHTTATGRGAGWAAALCVPGSAATGGGVYFGGDGIGVNGNPAIQKLAYFPAP
jgi:hypothetical protein